MNLVKASLRYPQVTAFLTALFVVAGIAALLQMPRREDPVVPIRRGLVLAAYPGSSAEQVEDQVTKKIEQRLFSYAEVRKAKTFSTSVSGGVVVNVSLNDDVQDPGRFWSIVRHDMNELSFTSLPRGVLGPIIISDFGDVLAILIAVTGDRYSQADLAVYQRQIESELLRIPSVAKVRRIGEQSEKVYITGSMQRLVQFGITPLHLVGALQSQNNIAEAGSFSGGNTRAPIRTTGLYHSEDEIRRQIVGMSNRGTPIYLGDVADVTRRQGEPDFYLRANGKQALMLSLEMRDDYNIVDFGREVMTKLEEVRAQLPPDVRVQPMVDQPQLVKERVGHFLVEFGLALVAVIAVTLLLLPFSVAAVASAAIPITVFMTFAMLRLLGIELHQVSLAALVVVLGIVVDDAIVIADNYVELLDEGVPKEDAAWRSATDLAVPVLAATVTIAAAFLPFGFIPGNMGEFIFSLPVTVALALGNSYIVAMLVTPLLCRAFVKKGLHAAHGAKAKRGPLEVMQSGYDRAIAYAMEHRRLTMAFGVVAVVAGLGLSTLVPQLFFPPAERDEFAINVWLPEGTRLESTNRAVLEIEKALATDTNIVSYASFVGLNAPRFFFSFEPLLPRPNSSQIIVRTTSVDKTPAIVKRLRGTLSLAIPDAEVDIQRLTQGEPMWMPIEVRVSGPDVATLKELTAQVSSIIEKSPKSFMVRNDFREDAYALQVNVNPELASRLGMTNTVVSNMLAGTFMGIPVSTLWEGDRSIDMVLRLDESHRATAEDVGATYMVSPYARAPLSSIAQVTPVWETGRIVRRNGVRTVTIGSFAADSALPSQLFAEVRPKIDSIALPPGYSIQYGGEFADQVESFGHLSVGMIASVLLIFVILLLQFKSIKDALVVMVSIPLALFGAYFGLLITRNPFGFTAFMGLISLTGVVVRNAIILIDYIRTKLDAGESLELAALEAGRRRLRPIFLTTVAAAAGLTPMIIARSGLWSPLASVIAIGAMFSMVFTLLIVPVLYVLVTRRTAPPAVVAPSDAFSSGHDHRLVVKNPTTSSTFSEM
jgi:multidrug efflux pump subunit AcrB